MSAAQYKQAFEIIAGGLVAAGIYLLIYYILSSIAFWGIFKKAGESGWKAFIPFYRTYIVFKIAWVPSKFIFWLIPVIVVGVCSGLTNVVTPGPNFSNPAYLVLSLISLVANIVQLVFLFKVAMRLAKSFGKTSGYGVSIALFIDLLVCLWPVAVIQLFMLGYGDAEYQGAQE